MRIAERAAELRGPDRGLRMPDALVVALADVRDDVNVLVGGDKRSLQLGGLSCKIELLRGGHG